MGGGPSVIRRATAEKSNTEFTSSLRTNFSAAQQAAANRENALHGQTNGAVSIGTSTPKRSSFRSWTHQEESQIFIPSINFSKSGLVEERPQYEITVKLFFLPNKPASSRCVQTREAVDLVLKELRVPSIDLLILSFPGIAFDADDEDDDVASVSTDPGKQSSGGDMALKEDADAEDIDTMLETWKCLERLHDEGVISKLGLSEFGSERLGKFLRGARIRPSVDQINVRDCCVVPKPLILYAKREGIELLTHNDCTNILPKGTTRELLGCKGGAGVLAEPSDDKDVPEEALKGDVEPQWVMKYTAVVKNRGVIENKGYFALAELREEF